MSASVRRKILVVDDERYIVQLVKGWLEAAGYAVTTAHDGEEALEKVRAERPDLIILDRWMPFVEGCEVLQTLKDSPDLRETPVVMLCAKSPSADDYPWCPQLPPEAASYLYKPFSREQLLSLVEHPRPGELPPDDWRLRPSAPPPPAAPQPPVPWWRRWTR
jgi:CheY-like chemotaxis protein